MAEARDRRPDRDAAADGPTANQFSLLGTRRFLPLFLVQFLGAFNDQVYQKAFIALLTYRLADQLETPLPLLAAIASGLFILPFAIITPTAGQIADRMDKAAMMRVVKFLEIVVMSLAIGAFYTQSMSFLYFVLFLMGAQSAMFAPIKYSVLPQYLAPGELVGGNGLVQASTFLAIIFGAIVGNELILTDFGVGVVSAFVVAVAAAGFVASLFAPPAPSGGADEPVDYLFPRAIWRLIARCRERPRAFRAILAISWFWFLGATFIALLPVYVKETLGADEGVLTVLMTAFSVGVAIGAIASERLNGGRVGVKVSPFGALGIGIMAIELWFATQGAPAPPPGVLIDRAAFLADPGGLRILADFVLLAAFGGVYVTPLNAVLQTASPDDERARFIACSNVVDATAMVLSAVAVAICGAMGLDAITVLSLCGLTGFVMAVAVARYAPETRFGRMALSAFPRSPSD
jgi:MFS family permease